jgi:hypothetical protein
MDIGYLIGPAIGGVIGVGGTLLGGTLTGKRDDRIRSEGREESRRAELKQAMWSYLGAVDALTAEMPDDHPVKPQPMFLDRWILRAAKTTGFDFLAYILGRLLQRAISGTRPHQLLDRMADASAHLRLVAPPAVEAYMIEGEALGRNYAPQDEQWLASWMEFRARMRRGFREALDDAERGTVVG